MALRINGFKIGDAELGELDAGSKIVSELPTAVRRSSLPVGGGGGGGSEPLRFIKYCDLTRGGA